MRRLGGNGDHGDIDPFLAHDPLQLTDVEDGHAASRFVADLRVGDIEERDNFKSLAAESGIVGEREPQIAGTHDCDAQLAVEPENLAQMALEILDVVADPPDAELTEVRQVLADLRGVQMELLGE